MTNTVVLNISKADVIDPGVSNHSFVYVISLDQNLSKKISLIKSVLNENLHRFLINSNVLFPLGYLMLVYLVPFILC